VKRALLAATMLALAPMGAFAGNYKNEAVLRSWNNEVSCTGERYWNEQRKRTFWTYGRPCKLTYEQCVTGYVDDFDGTHKVTGCIPDDGNHVRGLEAFYK